MIRLKKSLGENARKAVVEKFDLKELVGKNELIYDLQENPSVDIKLNNLVNLLKKTYRGVIPLIAYNKSPGERGSVPYWKAEVVRKEATSSELTALEQLSEEKKVIEVVIKSE